MNKKITIWQKIYLGALLHDIGKFYQRADKKFSDKYNELSKLLINNRSYDLVALAAHWV